ncbi:hypothetical protein DEO23_08305 [Brachybacterium endophyticum]|uniref:DUF5129 domain-containing protein n=1 Tax=Brachybacterium endophyticum TaxID=2182385 RepID=A0A2U2RLY9_9MICO|nr:DUF5129 domain-containing protein [Brachybacterium endophyticum]PWH06888.1 hypothetical protein DEO23_08305 [Brachybacterium endophyticum]
MLLPTPLHPAAAPPLHRPGPAALASRRSRGPFLAVLAAAVVASILLAPISTPAALAAPPSSVAIDDGEHVIDDPDALEGRLQQVSFREQVDVAVVTLDIADHGADPAADTGLNDAVLDAARTQHPEWIRGEKWADGMVILAIDPEGRKLGTYAGEDVKLSDGGFEDVQEAMREDAGDGAWDDAFVAGAQQYADLLGRPWWQSPAAIIVAFLALGALGAVAVAALVRGASARRRVRGASERHADVRARRMETDQAASRIPRDSLYGAAVLADVEDYRRAVDEAEEIAGRLPARPGPLWGIGAGSSRLAREYERSVGTADTADDTIIGAAALLGRSGDYAGAWQEERRPLDESIAAVDATVADVLDPDGTDEQQHALASSQAAAGLRATAQEVATELEQVTEAYLEGSTTPDAALERLDELTEQLAVASTRLREEAIDAQTEDEEEAEVMREADPSGFTDDFPGSVRGRRFARHPGEYVGEYSLSPVLWTGAWYAGAGTELTAHRNPSGTAGSTSGYSAGGFSGAGSSSSF